MKKRLIPLVLLCATTIHASYISEISVHSDVMNKNIPATIVFPSAYTNDAVTRYPVVYVLHGAGASYQLPLLRPRYPIHRLVDQYGVIAVWPDGAKTSWWLDSPIDPSMKYETFTAKELVAYIDTTYRTLATRTKRGIMGASMGGHGALFLSLRNKSVFGVVGNIFGGVDLRPFPDNWDIKLRLGSFQAHPDYWEQYSVTTQAKNLKNGELSLLSMVGDKDFFLGVNRALHQLLADNGVRHYYIEAQGAHTAEFCDEAFPVIFRFINNYFAEGFGHL